MSQPKEPKRWKWPRLYAFFEKDANDDDILVAMRIIYPNGAGDHTSADGNILYEWEYHWESDFACWAMTADPSEVVDQYAANMARGNLTNYIERYYPNVEMVYVGEIK